MIVECPSCAKANEITFGQNIVCHDCNKSFGGHHFKKTKKPLLATVFAISIGAFGTYKIDQTFSGGDRYPISVEYDLVNACANSPKMAISGEFYSNKKNICICALDKTMKKVKYEVLKKSESEFLTRFRDNVTRCMPN